MQIHFLNDTWRNTLYASMPLLIFFCTKVPVFLPQNFLLARRLSMWRRTFISSSKINLSQYQFLAHSSAECHLHVKRNIRHVACLHDFFRVVTNIKHWGLQVVAIHQRFYFARHVSMPDRALLRLFSFLIAKVKAEATEWLELRIFHPHKFCAEWIVLLPRIAHSMLLE